MTDPPRDPCDVCGSGGGGYNIFDDSIFYWPAVECAQSVCVYHTGIYK